MTPTTVTTTPPSRQAPSTPAARSGSKRATTVPPQLRGPGGGTQRARTGAGVGSATPPAVDRDATAIGLPADGQKARRAAQPPAGRATTPPPPKRSDATSPPGEPKQPATEPGKAKLFGRARIGGVAPAVRPKTWFDRLREGRLLERRGFVPLTPGRTKRRHRILPRTVIGISFMLLALATGVAFAGAGFYAYYDNRLAANEQEIQRFVEGFDEQFVGASDSLNQLRSDSLDQIRRELQPLGEYVSEQNGVVELPAQIGASVYQLRTTNERGTVVAGSAAAVAEHQGGTALVTSYTLVKSSTIAPSPGLELVKGEEKIPATLWSWDAERDLALVVVDVELPRLGFATEAEMSASVGSKVFAMSGTGGQGATASPGTVLDRSSIGYQHTAAVGDLFNGGPLVSSDGKLVGVASTSYAPLGFTGGDVRFATDLTGVCAKLLNCADPVAPESTEEGG